MTTNTSSPLSYLPTHPHTHTPSHPPTVSRATPTLGGPTHRGPAPGGRALQPRPDVDLLHVRTPHAHTSPRRPLYPTGLLSAPHSCPLFPHLATPPFLPPAANLWIATRRCGPPSATPWNTTNGLATRTQPAWRPRRPAGSTCCQHCTPRR